MDDNSLMPFGKYKGKKMVDVPDDYLLWLHKAGINNNYSDLREYIEENLDAIESNIKKDG